MVLAAVKRGKGILMKFCGADFYTFDVKKRMARVSKISLIAGCVVAATACWPPWASEALYRK